MDIDEGRADVAYDADRDRAAVDARDGAPLAADFTKQGQRVIVGARRELGT